MTFCLCQKNANEHSDPRRCRFHWLLVSDFSVRTLWKGTHFFESFTTTSAIVGDAGSITRGGQITWRFRPNHFVGHERGAKWIPGKMSSHFFCTFVCVLSNHVTVIRQTCTMNRHWSLYDERIKLVRYFTAVSSSSGLRTAIGRSIWQTCPSAVY